MKDINNNERKKTAAKNARNLLFNSFPISGSISSVIMGLLINYKHSSFVSFNPIVSSQALAFYSIEFIALIIFIRLCIKEKKKEESDTNSNIGIKILLFIMSIAPILLTNFPKYGNILTNTANIGNFIVAILPILVLIFVPVITGCFLRLKGAKFFHSDTGLVKCKEAPGVNPRKNPEPGKGNVESIASVTANELKGNQAGTDDSSANSSGNDASKFKISKADSDDDQGIDEGPSNLFDGVPGF